MFRVPMEVVSGGRLVSLVQKRKKKRRRVRLTEKRMRERKRGKGRRRKRERTTRSLRALEAMVREL